MIIPIFEKNVLVMIRKSKEDIIVKMELWRETLESKSFRISRTKTEYMKCKFNQSRSSESGELKLDDKPIPKSEQFRYIGSIIHKDGDISVDVAHRIQAGWIKWRSASGVLCDKNILNKLKGKFYRTTIRPAMLYGSECWGVKK